MCGFSGVIDTDISSLNVSLLENFVKSVSHRGPDGYGIVNDEVGSFNCSLSHYRLAIQGLGETGGQPWIHDNLIVLYNGEIYNYDALKEELSSIHGIILKTNCDTEVIPWLYSIYGHDFVSLLKGMFAIIVVDKLREEVTFYRDYFGIKPFYFLMRDSQVLFSSELSGFKVFGIEENYAAISSYFNFSYNILGESYLKGVQELAKGSFLNISLKEGGLFGIRYVNWTPKVSVKSKSYTELLKESVRSNLVSDVPIAISLSGGFDSSILLYYMKRSLSQIKAYTVDFGYNESDVQNAIEVSKAFDVDLEIINARIESNDFYQLLHEVYNNISEPIADSAYIGTYLVSYAARKDGYTVLISGAGGDEIFGGYTRYSKFRKGTIYYFLNKFVNLIPFFPFDIKVKNPRFHLLSNTSGCYKELKALTTKLDVRSLLEGLSNVTYPSTVDMMDLDMNFYLVNDILKLSDLSSMRNGVEMRVPYLDYGLLSCVRSDFKEVDYLYKDSTKVRFKSDYAEFLPQSLHKMKKAGFGAPVDFIVESCRDEILAFLKSKETLYEGLFGYFEATSVSNNFLFHLFVYVKWKESFLVL